MYDFLLNLREYISEGPGFDRELAALVILMYLTNLFAPLILELIDMLVLFWTTDKNDDGLNLHLKERYFDVMYGDGWCDTQTAKGKYLNYSCADRECNFKIHLTFSFLAWGLITAILVALSIYMGAHIPVAMFLCLITLLFIPRYFYRLLMNRKNAD